MNYCLHSSAMVELAAEVNPAGTVENSRDVSSGRTLIHPSVLNFFKRTGQSKDDLRLRF